MDTEDARDTQSDESPARREYRPPTLVTYGDAVQLTQSGRGSRADGGGKGARNRTS